MTGIALLLVAAALGLAFSHSTRIPVVPALILVGMLVSGLGGLPAEFLRDSLLLGLNVTVFVAGIELSPERIGVHRGAALRIGTVQFLVVAGLGFAVALGLEYPPLAAAYLALALAASSTLVVVGLLQSRQQLFEPFGRMVTGVLLLQDLLVILSIPVITRLSEGPASVTLGIASALLMVTISSAAVRWISPWLIDRCRDDEEVLLLVVLAVLFAFVALARVLGLPSVAGAFLGGVSLSSFPVRGLVRGPLVSLGDFFRAVFFVALGAFLPLPSWSSLLHAAVFTLVVVLLTPPLVALVAERNGFSARPALAAGLALAQTSEFSLVVGLQGLVLGQISEEAFGVIALITLVTMMLSPFLAADRVVWALVHLHPFRARRALPEVPRDHVLLVGCGRNGISLLEILIVSPNRVVVLDDDPALVHWLQESHIPAIRGDASDTSVLEAAGADRARIVVSTIRRTEDNGPLLAMARGTPVLVRAFDLEDARWLEARGGWPILYSEAAAEDFIAWFDAWIEEAQVGA